MEYTHRIGERVRLISEDYTEYGVVAWSYLNEQGDEDCYVTFFGTVKPDEDKKPQETPYVLRFYASSLTKGWQ